MVNPSNTTRMITRARKSLKPNFNGQNSMFKVPGFLGGKQTDGAVSLQLKAYSLCVLLKCLAINKSCSFGNMDSNKSTFCHQAIVSNLDVCRHEL